MELKLDAAQTQALIRGGLAAASRVIVDHVEPGLARIRLAYSERMLRPGGVISGPTLFAAADTAMFALVLSHLGPELMAVTANVNMNFLDKAAPGDVLGEARLLKLGRRLVVMEVRLYTSADPARVVAHVTGSYARPAAQR
ncbi:PaaI family thioesterase [Sinimarinibacterium thermocellulolyticum]|uniref:PaaI family thioesterase n=1 Tax=Sinimarinibacterium thermocellulolyticum TaxID=3170016 RepID=A0ABV2AC55_9GAMM